MLSKISSWFSRLGAVQVLTFDGETVRIAKGKPKPKLTGELREILQRTDSGPGEIHLNGSRRIQFHGKISPRAHQMIRNVIINTP